MSEPRGKGIRAEPPTIGLATAGILWLWGALLLWAPGYLGLGSPWDGVAVVLGLLALVLSFAGALTELGKLLQSQGLNYWGVSLVFLIPGVVLAVSVERGNVTDALVTPAKLGVLVLLAIGGAMFFYGVPYLFWQGTGSETGAKAPAGEEGKGREFRASSKAAANAIVALLALATAVVTLVEKLVK